MLDIAWDESSLVPTSWDCGTALLSAGWTRAFPLDIEWDESSLVLMLRNLQVHLSLSLSVDHADLILSQPSRNHLSN